MTCFDWEFFQVGRWRGQAPRPPHTTFSLAWIRLARRFWLVRCYLPKIAALPNSASISKRRLYLAIRSLRQAEPVLICPPPIATAKSARKASSVSPDRWETT